MASEIERLIDMLGCGNTMPQERIRWAHTIVELARLEGMKQQQTQDEQYDGYEREAYEQAEKNRIAAAHAEGVVEGAEQMANQVRFHGGQYTQKGDIVLSEYVSPGLAGRAAVDLFIVPTWVLAPTKEVAG